MYFLTYLEIAEQQTNRYYEKSENAWKFSSNCYGLSRNASQHLERFSQ